MTRQETEPVMPLAPLSDDAAWGRYYYQLSAYRQQEIQRLRAALEEIVIGNTADTPREIARRALYGDANEPT